MDNMAKEGNLNIEPSTIFCHDNLEILQGINTECIDLIYLDPPFNKKKQFVAPVGSSAEGAAFSDIFRQEDIKDDWVLSIKEDSPSLYELLDFTRKSGGRTSYNFCYLAYMAIRLIECRRILKDIGSIYLHCDPTMSHYLKLTLDCIFGEQNFRNEIIWGYRTQGVSKKWWPRKHDVIFMYVKSKDYVYHPTMERQIYNKPFRHTKIDDSGKHYADTYLRDVWNHDETKPTISQSPERTGYPTQKPLALLERIINASSNEGDIVLDPFCGCATTCVAAEKLKRKWIGIDVSHKAYELVKERLVKNAKGKQADLESDFKNGEISTDLYWDEKVVYRTSPPKRNDSGYDPIEKKYVYIISNSNYKGEYKVGIAKDWKLRLNNYQTSDPDRAYICEFHYLTPCYREIEKAVHDKFENKHEWVRAELKNIKKFIESYKPSQT